MRPLTLIACFALSIAAKHASRPSEIATVSRAVDGDTLELSDGRKVRLIGVDTPELHHPKKAVEAFAVEAQRFSKDAVAHKTVRLVFEKWNPIDKYGRLLAYVYREPDGLFLNRELLASGLAHVETRWPFAHLEEFRAAVRDASERGRGLWSQQ